MLGILLYFDWFKVEKMHVACLVSFTDTATNCCQISLVSVLTFNFATIACLTERKFYGSTGGLYVQLHNDHIDGGYLQSVDVSPLVSHIVSNPAALC